RSVDYAFDCGATAVTLIPTRGGNGAMEVLAERGEFGLPRLETLEAAMEYGVGLKRGRVFADLWDLQKSAVCTSCAALRVARLREMNLRQCVAPRALCGNCEGRS